MKYIRYILTFIALLSLAGCFGFSVTAALPDGEWDGISPMRNNRTYTLTSSVQLNDTLTIPSDSVLVIKEGASLAIEEGGVLEIYGGLNLRSGSSLISSGNIYVDNKGTLSVHGNIQTGENSCNEIAGMMDIQPNAYARFEAENIFDENCFITNSGQLFLVKGSSTLLKGELYVENDGELIAGGSLTIDSGGTLDSSGGIAIERKGTVSVAGTLNLRDGSGFTASGILEEAEGAIVNDLSTHTDLTIYTAQLLSQFDETVLRGIDVSWVQGEIDWKAVAESGVQFAIIRAGRGDFDGSGLKQDDYFVRNITGALENGIDVGVYFYSYAESEEQAENEAEFLIDAISDYEITFPVIMDMEEEPAHGTSATQIAQAFLETVADKGYFPMLYSYKAWINNHLDEELLEKYAVWVAQISEEAPQTEYNYYIWQYTHNGQVNGINGNVDYNVAFRDFPEIFRTYGLNGL